MSESESPAAAIAADVQGVGHGKDSMCNVRLVIKLSGKLGEDELRRITTFVDRCPVRGLLSHGATIETEVVHA